MDDALLAFLKRNFGKVQYSSGLCPWLTGWLIALQPGSPPGVATAAASAAASASAAKAPSAGGAAADSSGSLLDATTDGRLSPLHFNFDTDLSMPDLAFSALDTFSSNGFDGSHS